MRVSRGGRGVEGEGERESQADFMPSAEPNMRLDPTTLRSWPEPKSRVGCLTERHLGAPDLIDLSGS